MGHAGLINDLHGALVVFVADPETGQRWNELALHRENRLALNGRHADAQMILEASAETEKK